MPAAETATAATPCSSSPSPPPTIRSCAARPPPRRKGRASPATSRPRTGASPARAPPRSPAPTPTPPSWFPEDRAPSSARLWRRRLWGRPPSSWRGRWRADTPSTSRCPESMPTPPPTSGATPAGGGRPTGIPRWETSCGPPRGWTTTAEGPRPWSPPAS